MEVACMGASTDVLGCLPGFDHNQLPVLLHATQPCSSSCAFSHVWQKCHCLLPGCTKRALLTRVTRMHAHASCLPADGPAV